MTKSETPSNLKAYLDGDMAIGNIIPLRSVIESAIKYLEPSLPSNLDEVTMDFARELDFFLYGAHTRLSASPNSMQVRDEHSGLKVNDWKCWVNRPEYRIEMVKHFFTLGKQAGAEWMAGQGVTVEGDIEGNWRNHEDAPYEIYVTSDCLPKDTEFKLGNRVVVQIRKK